MALTQRHVDRSLRGQRAQHLHACAHARTLFRATYTERKGVVPSLTCRRLEGERTIAGAERTRQLRSMMFFLGFWNSLTPLSVLSTYLPLSTITSLLCPLSFAPFVFLLYSFRLRVPFSSRFSWISFTLMINLSLFVVVYLL